MKYLLFLFGLALLVGAGCNQQAPAQKANVAFSPNDPLCVEAAKENDAGARTYPVASRYNRFPHLGQIFTALDCGNRDRALGVKGFQDGKYRDGIMFRWSTGAPPSDFEAALKALGFVEEAKGAWATREPLTLDELTTLQPFILDPAKNGGLEMEDCILCG